LGVILLLFSAPPIGTRSSCLKGCAHGYCTLDANTEVIYKVNAYYSPEHDRGLLWSDPALGIAWPVSEQEVLISDKDRSHPVLSQLPQYFSYKLSSNRQG
jgi:dTDP-4-dehydrorhamnose 3,5-epimerase